MLTGTYHYPRADGVVFGLPWQEALRAEVERLGARKVFAVVSSSLKAAMPLEADLRRALGERLAGVGDGVRAHSPREDVARVARAARDAGADLLVAVGGGSVVDAAKVTQLCLAHSVFAAEAFDALRGKRREGAAAAELTVRVVAVPSTLSGAEFTAIAGVTNVARNVKEGYAHPDLAPRAVVLDPRITVHTPAALWLSTGIRAVDHAVEDLCSINSQPLADAASLHALRLLSRGLRRTKTDPGDLDARLDSMIGAWLSLVGTQGGVHKGASHAIGHVLGGTAGVPHGFTSCVMLAHVLRWNKAVNADRQKLVSEALGDGNAEAADLVAQLVADLGLPRTLRDVKVTREQLRTIAEHTMHDPWTATNPRKIAGPEDILEILEMAW
jgi:maleylacetate reductase